MKKTLLIVSCILVTHFLFSQEYSKEYTDFINSGFTFYSKQDYKNAAIKFSSAINLAGDKVDINIRRATAFCWALANYPDSAFYQLDIVSNFENLTYPDYVNFTSDNDFTSLHADPRWKKFCKKTFNTAKKAFHSSLKSSGGEVSVFNLYNAACAISIAKTVLNVTQVQIQKGFQAYSTIFGRGEKITLKTPDGSSTAWIYLIKN